MSKFSNLYFLAHSILTSSRSSSLGRLSKHSGLSESDAHSVLRQAILQATMPGERGDTAWAVVRVFMRNLVNRAFAPVNGDEMRALLTDVQAQKRPEEGTVQFEQAMNLLASKLAQRSTSLAASLNTLRTVSPLVGQSYISWLMQKASEYSATPTGQLDPERVLADVRIIASEQPTKIPNMGVALAANLLADIGAPAFAKPDKHVLLSIAALMPADDRVTPESCIRKIIEIAQDEAPLLLKDPDFEWMTNGLCPRHLDRLIYLVGSDNYLLDGKQNKRWAPLRRELIRTVLRGGAGGDLVGETALPNQPPPSLASSGSDFIATDIVELSDQIQKHQAQNPELSFYEKLEGNATALNFLDRVIELAATEGAQVHYTFTEGGDFRIRAFRAFPSPLNQNVVVLRWRVTKNSFYGMLMADCNACHAVGLLAAVSIAQVGSPLRSQIYLDPTDEAQVNAFGMAVELSIRAFTEVEN